MPDNPSLQELADAANARREPLRDRRDTVIPHEMPHDSNAHNRIDRLERRVDGHNDKLGVVAENVSWIKGYLENQNTLKTFTQQPEFKRDAGMVVGGGGIVGGLMLIIEWLMRSSGGS